MLINIERVDPPINLKEVMVLLATNGYDISGPYALTEEAGTNRSVAEALAKATCEVGRGLMPSDESLRDLASDYISLSHRFEDLRNGVRAALDDA